MLEQIERAKEETGLVIVIGDLNLNSQDWSKKDYKYKTMKEELMKTTMKCGLQHLDFGITFRREHKDGTVVQSSLDHAFVDNLERVKKHYVQPCTFSDHEAIVIELNWKAKKNQYRTEIMRRNWNNIRKNPAEFKKQLQSEFDRQEVTEDLDKMVNDWNAIFQKVFDNLAPMKKKSASKKRRTNISPELQRLMAQKKKVYQEYVNASTGEEKCKIKDEFDK